MDCREFRNKHVAFVDDLLSAVEMEAMRRHLTVCSNCSRQDTRVRRSLMVVRSLPPIAASPDFMQRLSARIDAIGPVDRTDIVTTRFRGPSVGAFAALAAGIAAVAYMAIETNNYFVDQSPSVAAPAVATANDNPSTPAMMPAMPNAALVASVPTGIPVWPGVLMAGQSPVRFASLQFDVAGAR